MAATPLLGGQRLFSETTPNGRLLVGGILRTSPGERAAFVLVPSQWRTQKIFVVGVHSVAYGGHCY